MKKIVFVLVAALSLCAGSVRVQAHGGYCGPFFWPFIPFGLGLGIGYSMAAANYRYGYPTYVYSQPTYYAYPSTTHSQPAATVAVPPTAEESPVWVPSTPGTGQWVPDPHPYQYTPTTPAKAATVVTPNLNVAVSRLPGGVTVYTIGR